MQCHVFLGVRPHVLQPAHHHAVPHPLHPHHPHALHPAPCQDLPVHQGVWDLLEAQAALDHPVYLDVWDLWGLWDQWDPPGALVSQHLLLHPAHPCVFTTV